MSPSRLQRSPAFGRSRPHHGGLRGVAAASAGQAAEGNYWRNSDPPPGAEKRGAARAASRGRPSGEWGGRLALLAFPPAAPDGFMAAERGEEHLRRRSGTVAGLLAGGAARRAFLVRGGSAPRMRGGGPGVRGAKAAPALRERREGGQSLAMPRRTCTRVSASGSV